MRNAVVLCGFLAVGCSDSGVTKHNSAPEARITSHEDGESIVENTLIALRGKVGDPNHSADSLVVTWLIDGIETCAGSAPDGDGSVTCDATFELGAETGKVVLEVSDPDGSGASDQVDLDVQADDSTIGTVSIEPASLYTNDIASAVVTITAADGEDLTLSYTFTVDGTVAQEGSDDTLDGALHFDKGQSVTVAVIATGSFETTTLTSTPVTVLNTAPGAPAVAIDNSPACGEDWTMMPGEDRCVLAIGDITEWEFAEAECVATGGHLVRIADAAEASFLSDLYFAETGDPEGFWAGYTDQSEEGAWVWTDDGSTTFTDWIDGEPNNLGESGEHCLHVTGSGGWNDLGCDDTADTLQGYICQVSARATSLTCLIEEESTDADEDTVSYTFGWDIDGTPVPTTETTFHDGDTIAAHLLSTDETLTCTVLPSDGESNGAAGSATFAHTNCDSDGDGFYSDSVDCGGDDCDDSDATINPIGGDTYGDGIDSDCDELDCEAASDGSTYFALCGPSRWEDAEPECTSRGLAFGSIRSAAENDFVTELMRGSDLYFMPESSVGEAVWIGFSDIADEGVWVWEDGYTGGYANWFPGEPNDLGGQDCAYLDTNPDTRDGLWDDAGCGEVGGERVFLCTRR